MRVLVVEDEALVAMEIEMMIALAGHEAIAHADDLDGRRQGDRGNRTMATASGAGPSSPWPGYPATGHSM